MQKPPRQSKPQSKKPRPLAPVQAAPLRPRPKAQVPDDIVINDVSALSALARQGRTSVVPHLQLPVRSQKKLQPGQLAVPSLHVGIHQTLSRHLNMQWSGALPHFSGLAKPAPATLYACQKRTSVHQFSAVKLATPHLFFSQIRAYAGWEPSTAAEVATIELIKCTLLAAERSGQPFGQPVQSGGQPGQLTGLASGHPGQALLGRLSREQLAQSYAYLCTREQVYPGGISKAYALSGAFKESLQVGLCLLYSGTS